ncbi:hypothetical protein [Mesorhizobium opportunistum]|uniref:Uncharacterized protein n=1 Tax=Mesorhizobium opportunistum (strain LMG 24607 / HAMBI 3007 / WSM2075) TaxID=536019 RepID=F7Y0Z1_MESOW|nr:hypothetical protein [Mesorhizobium opportunistum]AEH88204.1 hypothetical protein Mesop_3763 [Mesorhizobium opportunistum WSM2075]
MFYFAWVNATDTIFGSEHEVEDEQVLSIALEQKEGELASLSISVRNPRTGLLAPGRKQWMWLSWFDAANPTAGAQALFFGRIVGVPSEPQGNAVTLQFIARPADYDAQKLALAETLKVAPYWDPMWIQPDSRDDPDTVLEARTQLYHTDRVSHEVTVSDMLIGEDGLLDFGGDFLADSFDIAFSSPPVRTVTVEASVKWDQIATGVVDITKPLLDAFRAAGSGSKSNIRTLTGDGLMLDWPVEEKNIGGGWAWGPCKATRSDGTVVPQDYSTVIMTNGNGQFPIWTIKPLLQAAYDVSRPKEEVLSFTLEADVQALLTEPGDEEVIAIKASGNADELVDPADTDHPAGTAPIGDVRRRAYFPTERGLRSLDYLIALARGNILERSRAVEVTVSLNSFAAGVDLTCRKNARIVHALIPGGEATGKIIGYSLTADGGKLLATVTIGCTIGKGNTVTISTGTPDYVEDGYVDAGYQTYTGQTLMPIAGAVTYGDFSNIPPVDDGVDFFDMRPADMVEQITIINPLPTQQEVLDAFKPDLQAAIDALNQVFTEVDGDLKKLTIGRDDPPFLTLYPITVSQLMVPKTINLEAA